MIAVRMPHVRRLAPFVLLAFIPVAVALQWLMPERHALVFATSALALLPLAGYIGSATEQLAERFGGGIGGLLNATFGNAAELIIAALALRHGLVDLVKASITGSIIGNILLVFGASAVVGGLSRPVQRFNRTTATTATTMLMLSVVALVVPAAFHWLSRNGSRAAELELDTEIAVVLLLTYACYLFFTLRTHRHLLGAAAEHGSTNSSHGVTRPLLSLVVATAATAYMSELLVGSMSETAADVGFSQLFVGVVIVGLVGNAAEHYSAVTLAAKDDMDAALVIAVGSSTQVALFVAPVLVLVSYVIAPTPMDLLFTPFELVAIGLSVVVIAFIAHDGETHWMEGIQLLAVYAILAMGFYFLR